jgi:hypothetical protein
MKHITDEQWQKLVDDIHEKNKGNLTVKEYEELLALEYVLDQGYSQNPEKDTKRYIKLSNKKYS